MLPPGSVISRYRVVSVLGKGGMGMVYKGVNDKIGRYVAIKVLSPQLSENPEHVQRFFNEARATNKIQHPSIVAIDDCDMLPNGQAYLVMEFLDGPTVLARLRERGGRLPIDEAVSICRQIASTLDAAHHNGIIHRDLKPDNVILIADPLAPRGERIKLLDFGIAKLVEVTGSMQSNQTQAGMLMGTPSYMSPEQAEATIPVTDRTDCYSLGVMLFQLTTGQLPFVGNGLLDLLRLHRTEQPPRLGELCKNAPRWLEQLVSDMLTKEPGRRPSMREVEERLFEFDYSSHPKASGSVASGSRAAVRPVDSDTDPVNLTDASGSHPSSETQYPTDPDIQFLSDELNADSDIAALPESTMLPVGKSSDSTFGNTASQKVVIPNLGGRAWLRASVAGAGLALGCIAIGGMIAWLKGSIGKRQLVPAVGVAANRDLSSEPHDFASDSAVDQEMPDLSRPDDLATPIAPPVAPKQECRPVPLKQSCIRDPAPRGFAGEILLSLKDARVESLCKGETLVFGHRVSANGSFFKLLPGSAHALPDAVGFSNKLFSDSLAGRLIDANLALPSRVVVRCD